jgi:hypothetical protein
VKDCQSKVRELTYVLFNPLQAKPPVFHSSNRHIQRRERGRLVTLVGPVQKGLEHCCSVLEFANCILNVRVVGLQSGVWDRKRRDASQERESEVRNTRAVFKDMSVDV